MYPPTRSGSNSQTRLNTGLRGPTGYAESRITPGIGASAWTGASERPVTQQGVAGIKPATAGPKRKVLSRSYFQVLLRQKINEMTVEIARFREEASALKKDQGTYSQYTSRQTELFNEVQKLEGVLTDHNTAGDKYRAGGKAEEMVPFIEHLTAQNARLRSQLDELFIERKSFEDKCSEADERIKELRAGAEVRVNELSAGQREEYRRAEATQRELEAEVRARSGRVEELDRKLLEQEARLRADLPRLKAIQVKEGLSRLEKQREVLEDQLKENAMGFNELRQKLMDNIKEEKTEVTALEKRVKELRRLADASRLKLTKMEEALRGESSMTDDKKRKFEVLYAKEREVDTFLSSFDSERAAKVSDLEASELAVARLLETAARGLGMARAAEKGDDPADSRPRLLAQILQKQEELKRVEEIEKSLPERVAEMRRELEALRSQSSAFERADLERSRLEKQIGTMRNQMAGFDQLATDLEDKMRRAEGEYNAKLSNLQGHACFESFVEAERQLSQSHQLLFSITNYIRLKESETVYDDIIAKVMGLTNAANKLLIQNKH